MMKTIVHETQIFGPIGLFSNYLLADVVQLEMMENYQKRSHRNRYQILTSNGVMKLTIPLIKGKNSQMPIQDVQISYDENWFLNHIQSIRSAYGKSPYFEFYFDKIEHILLKKHRFLFDLNQDSLEFAIQNLKLETKIQHTTEYLNYADQVNTTDLRNIDKSQGTNKTYIQVWDEKYDFQAQLSVIDLLFCTGPEARLYL